MVVNPQIHKGYHIKKESQLFWRFPRERIGTIRVMVDNFQLKIEKLCVITSLR